MKTTEIKFKPLEVQKSWSKARKEFRKSANLSNILYFFFNNDTCYYIGESSVSLNDRCFRNTPKHVKKEWFAKCNKVLIIQLDKKLGDIERRALESSFILAYKSAGHPLQNEK